MPEPTAPVPAPAPAGVAVLIVCADARQPAVRAAVLAAAPAADVAAVDATLDAIRLALSTPPDLVIVDWAIADAGAPALLRLLQRARPPVPALAFDDLTVVPSPAVRPWAELPRALARWAARHDAARSTRS